MISLTWFFLIIPIFTVLMATKHTKKFVNVNVMETASNYT